MVIPRLRRGDVVGSEGGSPHFLDLPDFPQRLPRLLFIAHRQGIKGCGIHVIGVGFVHPPLGVQPGVDPCLMIPSAAFLRSLRVNFRNRTRNRGVFLYSVNPEGTRADDPNATQPTESPE